MKSTPALKNIGFKYLAKRTNLSPLKNNKIVQFLIPKQLGQATSDEGDDANDNDDDASDNDIHVQASCIYQHRLVLFNMGLSWPLFGFIISFSWYMFKFQFINFSTFTDDRKQERIKRVRTILLHIIRKSPTNSENILTAILI